MTAGEILAVVDAKQKQADRMRNSLTEDDKHELLEMLREAQNG